ncbi:MAG: hypothetical protein HYR60_05335 [Acidobacteria bacterium]|nr:hypothetical protein [Acidobacteriota bacterium]
MLNTLGPFCYLQLLDFLTTIAFLMQGVQEANPVVRWAIQAGGTSPLGGLVAVKLVAMALGLYCWHRGKLRLLGSINLLFAAVVTWNVLAIILHAAGIGFH